MKRLAVKYKKYANWCKLMEINLLPIDLLHIDKMINKLPVSERRKTLIKYARERLRIQNEYISHCGYESKARREANLWLLDECNI